VAEDVSRVVTAARDSGLELAVRSGGHNRAGYSASEGGIVLDLSGMKGLEIDAEGRTAWVESGVTAGEYTNSTGEHGLATGLGDAATVGISGITLAGGVGFLVRKNGLTIDDLLAAELVTADGEIVRVSEESEPDLFWAIRGGGGNFGVATRLQLRLHEISEIVGGMLILPATPEVILRFLEVADEAPEDLSAIANVMIAPPMPFVPEEAHGKPIVMATMAYVGPPNEADAAISPFRAIATPLADMVRPIRYPEMYEEGPEPQLATGANFFVDSIDSAGAAAILDALQKSTAMMKAVQLRVLGGAMARVPVDATAFAQRNQRMMVNVAAMFADPAEKETHDAWAAGLAGSLSNSSPRGGYVGFLGDEPGETIRACYGGNWDRLRDLKRRYDPDNLFRLNHNIPPAD
jgi:FAD/FMN-containing dehydrogenase